MDLLKIYNENQEREKQKEELKLQEKINELVSEVIQNKSDFISDDEKVFKELKIKFKKEGCSCSADLYNLTPKFQFNYIAPINKTNIKKLNDYINKRSNNEN